MQEFVRDRSVVARAVAVWRVSRDRLVPARGLSHADVFADDGLGDQRSKLFAQMLDHLAGEPGPAHTARDDGTDVQLGPETVTDTIHGLDQPGQARQRHHVGFDRDHQLVNGHKRGECEQP